MTTKQKKGVQTAVLTLLFVLFAIGVFFDARHGSLDVQAETGDSASQEYVDLWRTKADPQAEGLSAARVPPGAVANEKRFEIEKVNVENEPIVAARDPVASDGVNMIGAVGDSRVSVRPEPAPEYQESSFDDGEDHRRIVKVKRIRTPVPDPEPDPDPGDDPGPGADNSKDEDGGYSRDGDRNRGHGNDEDGYDEDNPGRGSRGGAGYSEDRGGRKGSGCSDKRGKSGRRGGSKRRG